MSNKEAKKTKLDREIEEEERDPILKNANMGGYSSSVLDGGFCGRHVVLPTAQD